MIFYFKLSIFIILIGECSPTFTKDFQTYLINNYNETTLKTLERLDMGNGIMGSFGGKEYDLEVVKKKPVIFIHGTTLRAGVFTFNRNYFMKKGYTSFELYATTFADGGKTYFYNKPMYCEDVKQVRNFIKVVADYTNSTVNVLGYSMGSPISRKAILGGKCVDTHEDLGEPLTPLVNTFISLAGVTYGLQPCLNYKTYAACNLVNGMISGSEYLNDINSMETKYEGNTTYSIQSSNDYLVGQKCGSEQCSELKNSNENIYKNGNDHVTIVSTTVALQYELFDKL